MHEIPSRAHGRFAADAERSARAREAIIAAKREGVTHEEAAQRARVTRRTMQRWLNSDSAFAAAVHAAEEDVRKARIAAALVAYRKAA